MAGLALATCVVLAMQSSAWAQQRLPAPPQAPPPGAPDQAAPAPKPGVNPEAQLLVDFKDRIDKYIKLRDEAKKSTPPMKQTTDPAAIKSAQESLATRISQARADAKPGDIFTPAIQNKFRRLLNPELKGEDGKDAKAVVKDDAPPVAAVPFKPNAPYPEGKPFPTVPVNLLASMPPLPKELEYRIIDKHLILRDTDANIIVDYIPYVIR